MNQFVYTSIRNFNMPRCFVLLADLSVTAAGFVMAYVLRLNFNLRDVPFVYMTEQLLIVILPLYLAAFLITGSYRGIIRHSSIEDAVRLCLAVSSATLLALVVAWLAREFSGLLHWQLPYSVILIHAAVISVVMMGGRIIIRSFYYTYIIHHKGYRHVLIFGAGEMGKIAKNVLENEHQSRIHVMGFIDDDKALVGKRLMGKPIFSECYALKKVIKSMEIREVILAVDKGNIEPERKKLLFDHCLMNGVGVREVSAFSDWIGGKLSLKQINEVQIEDLLGREPIQLNLTSISKGLKNTVILVTGAAGSIGAELVRQLLSFDLKKLVLLDQAESGLYDLQNELKSAFAQSRFDIVVASVTDRRRMRYVFEKYHPDYLFNAAAYKHVPLMEEAPYEAIRVNVGGTCLLADLSVEFNVKKFVMISTDKAVNPTNVMGASKRICELYIQALSQSNHKETQFITTRFGNVLGSNGSVIPLFRRQIETGKPVTVTHPDIIRYFMTIAEACQLVLEAGFMGYGGEIFMFDMGKPVRIYDLAVKMIALAGLKPENVPIEITGLRPGEKLYEELLTNHDNTIQTHHPKIRLAKVCQLDFGLVKFAVDALLIASQIENEEELVCRMKALIPEFVSQNSKFSTCDKIVGKNNKS